MGIGAIYDTIVKVINTEKSATGLSEGKYYFEVKPDSTKETVKKAVEQAFSAKVKSVNKQILVVGWTPSTLYYPATRLYANFA